MPAGTRSAGGSGWWPSSHSASSHCASLLATMGPSAARAAGPSSCDTTVVAEDVGCEGAAALGMTERVTGRRRSSMTRLRKPSFLRLCHDGCHDPSSDGPAVAWAGWAHTPARGLSWRRPVSCCFGAGASRAEIRCAIARSILAVSKQGPNGVREGGIQAAAVRVRTGSLASRRPTRWGAARGPTAEALTRRALPAKGSNLNVRRARGRRGAHGLGEDGG